MLPASLASRLPQPQTRRCAVRITSTPGAFAVPMSADAPGTVTMAVKPENLVLREDDDE